MEIGEYLTVLRRNWIVIMLVGLVGFAVAYAYSTNLPPTYRATASVWVTVPQSESVGERVQGATYAQDRVDSYAELATKPFVLDPVIDELELQTTAHALQRSVTVTSPLNTAILDISAVSGDSEQAAAVANAVSSELARAVAELEGGSAGDEPAVQLTVVARAAEPEFAFGPNTRLNAATGLALGLALGVILALARTVLDTRVRSVKDVARVTDTAVVSSVRRDKSAQGPLFMINEPFGEQAESYRRLRTNLRFLRLAGPSRSIMVTSAVPTEGKTVTAINLAIALAEGSSRVILIDADLRRPSVARYLGLEGAAGLTTVLIGEATPEEVIQPWAGRLDVLTSGQIPPNPSELLDSSAMAELLGVLGERYDLIVVDSAPLVPVTDAAALSHLLGGTLLVAGCRTVRRAELAEAVSSLAAVGARVLGIVLNQVSAKEGTSTYAYGSTPRETARTWSPAAWRRRSAAARRSGGDGSQSPAVPDDAPDRKEGNDDVPVGHDAAKAMKWAPIRGDDDPKDLSVDTGPRGVRDFSPLLDPGYQPDVSPLPEERRPRSGNR